MTALVTVVIPAWDAYAEVLLSEAVESVRSQDCAATVIVVDNASTVALPELNDVQFVRLERRVSTGAARNASLSLLATPYVVFLDADDLLLPGALTALVESIDGDPDLSASALSIIDAVSGGSYRSPRRLAGLLARFPPLFSFADAVWSLLPTQGCTIMRVQNVLASGGYDDSNHGEDWVLAISLTFRGRVHFDRRPGLRYRRRDDSPGTRALDAGLLRDNARRVRVRIRADPAAPSWIRSALPLIAVAQSCAARLAHPLYRSVRSLLTRHRSY